MPWSCVPGVIAGHGFCAVKSTTCASFYISAALLFICNMCGELGPHGGSKAVGRS